MPIIDFTQHGDDSSDEESSADLIDFTETQPEDNSFLSFALGLELLHTPEVNAEYYPLKKALGPHTLNATQPELQAWCHESIQLSLTKTLMLEHKPALAQQIITKLFEQHDASLQQLISMLRQEIRLFFKQQHFTTTLPKLKELLTPFINSCLQTILTFTDAEIIEPAISFSINELLRDNSLKNKLIEKIKNYLNHHGLIANDKLIPKKGNQRKQKIDKIKETETSAAYIKILDALKNAYSKKIDVLLNENKDIFCAYIIKEQLYPGHPFENIDNQQQYMFPYQSAAEFISTYNDSPNLWQRYLPTDIEALKQRCNKDFYDAFFKTLPSIIKQQQAALNITLDRPVLPQQYLFKPDNIYQYFASLRLYYRDIQRRARQIADDNTPLFDGETLNRSWQFGQVPAQSIETLSISKNGAVTQLVTNLGSYEKIHKKIQNTLGCLNQELQANNQPPIAQAFFAHWMLQIIQHAGTINFQYSDGSDMHLSKITKKNLTHFFVNLTYLLLGCEAIRNPAALVSNILVLLMIRDGQLSWQAALNKKVFVHTPTGTHQRAIPFGGGLIPMTMGGYQDDTGKKRTANPVPAARALQSQSAAFGFFRYHYPGPSSNPDDTNTTELNRRQCVIIAKNLPPDQPDATRTSVIKDKVKTGYGL